MVGHTKNLGLYKNIEAVDCCLQKWLKLYWLKNGVVLITADLAMLNI